jgi:hypothetical protein
VRANRRQRTHISLRATPYVSKQRREKTSAQETRMAADFPGARPRGAHTTRMGVRGHEEHGIHEASKRCTRAETTPLGHRADGRLVRGSGRSRRSERGARLASPDRSRRRPLAARLLHLLEDCARRLGEDETRLRLPRAA